MSKLPKKPGTDGTEPMATYVKRKEKKMIYKETFKPGLKDIGKDNKIKNKAILEFLENIAAYHSDYVRTWSK